MKQNRARAESLTLSDRGLLVSAATNKTKGAKGHAQTKMIY